jgi:hypothetical protein
MARKNNLKMEGERLERRERLLREQLEACTPSLSWAWNDILEHLNTALAEKDKFARELAAQRFEPVPTDEDLHDLCELAKDVAEVWHHTEMTDFERKEIVRALIEKVVVNCVTKEKIEGTICWASGATDEFMLYRWAGRDNLIRELYAEGCTTGEIIDRLARGETSTGQTLKLCPNSFFDIYKRLGVRPNLRPSWLSTLAKEAKRRRLAGESNDQIAADFNARGLTTHQGLPWTKHLVFNLTGAIKNNSLDALHREVFIDAKRRGLGCVTMAKEFNARKIPRYNGKPWLKSSVLQTWRAIVKREPELRYLNRSKKK